MVVVATGAVSAGEPLTLPYVDIMEPLFRRQQVLLEQHCFRCNCSRCQSPLDDDALLGGLRCESLSTSHVRCRGFLRPCSIGYNLVGALDTTWECALCGQKVFFPRIIERDADLQRIFKNDPAGFTTDPKAEEEVHHMAARIYFGMRHKLKFYAAIWVSTQHLPSVA